MSIHNLNHDGRIVGAFMRENHRISVKGADSICNSNTRRIDVICIESVPLAMEMFSSYKWVFEVHADGYVSLYSDPQSDFEMNHLYTVLAQDSINRDARRRGKSAVYGS